MKLLFRSAVIVWGIIFAAGCTPRDLQVASPDQRALIKQTGGKRGGDNFAKSEFFISKAGLALHLIERQMEVVDLLRVISDESKSETLGFKILNSTKNQNPNSFVLVFSKSRTADTEEISSTAQEHFVADVIQKDETQLSVVVRSRGAFRQISRTKSDSKISINDSEKEIYFKCAVTAELKTCYFEYYVKSQIKFSKGTVSEVYTLNPDITGVVTLNKADEISVSDTDRNVIRLEEKNLVVEIRLNDSIRIGAGSCFPSAITASLVGGKGGSLNLNGSELVFTEGDRAATKVSVTKCEDRSAAFFDLEKLLEAKSKKP